MVGDAQNLQYYEYKKGELINDSKAEAQDREISRVVISGTGAKFSVFYAAG